MNRTARLPALSLSTIALLCLSALVAPAMAADYYVATNGDDANPGSLDKPFKSPVKAAAKLMPGDTLFFRAGTYICQTNGTVGLAPPRSGEPGKPITFKNYNNEHVCINGGKSDWGFTPNGYSWIVIDGFEVTGPEHYGMKISGQSGNGKQTGDHITIRNCEVHHSGMENIFSFGTPYLTIENCHLHDSQMSHGLYLSAGCHNAVVRNVTSEDNHGNSGMQLNAAGGGIKNALVEDCLLRNNAQGFSLMGVQDSVFRGNIVFNDCFDGPRGAGYRELILWTYAEPGKEATPCKNVLFEHNTFVNTRPEKINQLVEIKAKTAAVTFRWNIFSITAKRPIFTVAADSAEGLVIGNNLLFTPLAYEVNFGIDKLKTDEFLKQIKAPGRNLAGDPNLADPAKGDFTPKAGSPALRSAFQPHPPTCQPDEYYPGGPMPDIGAVQTGHPRQIGCKLPWKTATTQPQNN